MGFHSFPENDLLPIPTSRFFPPLGPDPDRQVPFVRLRRRVRHARGLRGTHDPPGQPGRRRDEPVQVGHVRVHAPVLLKVQELGGQVRKTNLAFSPQKSTLSNYIGFCSLSQEELYQRRRGRGDRLRLRSPGGGAPLRHGGGLVVLEEQAQLAGKS